MNVWWLLGGFVVSLVSIVYLCARLPVTAGSVVPSFPVETIENRPWLRVRVCRVGLRRVETVGGKRRLPEAKWPVARPAIEDPGSGSGLRIQVNCQKAKHTNPIVRWGLGAEISWPQAKVQYYLHLRVFWC